MSASQSFLHVYNMNSLIYIHISPSHTFQIIAFLASGFFYIFGLVGWVSLIGDFSRYKLSMTDSSINQGSYMHCAIQAAGLVES